MLVKTERRNQVEVITINRPEARDAIDPQGDVLVAVFTSPVATEGPRAFAENRQPNWTSA